MYLMSGQCNSERSVGKLLQAFLSTSLIRNQPLEIFWVANDSTGTSCEGMNRRGKNNPGLAVDTLRSAFRPTTAWQGFKQGHLVSRVRASLPSREALVFSDPTGQLTQL